MGARAGKPTSRASEGPRFRRNDQGSAPGRGDYMNLHDFIIAIRDDLIARTKAKVSQRPWPSVSTSELKHGIPLFLSQVAETLRLERTEVPFSASAIGLSATKHGGELLAMGASPCRRSFTTMATCARRSRNWLSRSRPDHRGGVPYPEPLSGHGHCRGCY